jgi:hypothetical protein
MKIVLYSIQLIKLEVELWEARVKAHKIEIHIWPLSVVLST